MLYTASTVECGDSGSGSAKLIKLLKFFHSVMLGQIFMVA